MAHRDDTYIETQVLTELPGPGTGSYYHPLRPDGSCRCSDSPYCAVDDFHTSDWCPGTNDDPTITGSRSIRCGHRARLHIAITRHEQNASGFWHFQGWHERSGVLRRQPFDRIMQRPGGFDTGFKAGQVWLSKDNTEAAVLVKVDGVACGLRKAFEKLNAIGRKRQQVLVGREIRRLAGRKGSRPSCNWSSVKQRNRLVPCRRELKGSTGTECPTANNDNLCLARNHTMSLRWRPQVVLKV
jgi:hypothetical protein